MPTTGFFAAVEGGGEIWQAAPNPCPPRGQDVMQAGGDIDYPKVPS